VPQKDDAVVAGLLVNGERIYVAVEGKKTEEGTLLVLDLDGKIVWQQAPGGKLYSTPVVAGNLVLVAPYQADYALVAYDVDGKQVWTFTPEK
jgi:outer membrane protein assembly factor BamB